MRTDLAFMDAVETPCKRCKGTGYSDEALAVRVAGRTIADVAALSAIEAQEVFRNEPTISAPLRRMQEVGLGYMSLGQQLNSLSGGERQRLRLADELGRQSAIYLLDEPTSGLHMSDVDTLLDLFDHLLGDGKSLVVVEHNLQVMAKADWIIEMGPGAGKHGGRIIFEGTAKDMLLSKKSVTKPFLEKYLKG
jgi:excinuclease UvrABC ATPase subunit